MWHPLWHPHFVGVPSTFVFFWVCSTHLDKNLKRGSGYLLKRIQNLTRSDFAKFDISVDLAKVSNYCYQVRGAALVLMMWSHYDVWCQCAAVCVEFFLISCQNISKVDCGCNMWMNCALSIPHICNFFFSLFRKLSDPNAAANVEEKQYEEVASEADVPSISSLELLTPEKLDRIAPFFKSSSSQVVRKVPFPKRTVAPGPTKRVRGQYFLDLGQADFSHTTCSSCGLVYARGLESDEKLHTSFHRSQLKGIHFKVHTSTACVPSQHF